MATVLATMLVVTHLPVDLPAEEAYGVAERAPDPGDDRADDLYVALAPDGEDLADLEVDAPSAPAPHPVVAPCRGRYCFDRADVLAVLTLVGPRTACVMRREMGPQLDPNAVGRAGEIGPIQLHPNGKLAEYLATGRDPWSPYDAGPWLQSQLERGQGNHWSPIRLGMC